MKQPRGRPLLLLWIACLCAAPLPGRAHDADATPAEAKADAAPVILLTGFEVFGNYKVNASWETVKTFQGQTISGYRIETAELPVVYDEMAAPLQAAIEKHKPAVVISFGVGSRVPRLETVARNGYHPAKPKDNKGKAPPREKVEADGPATIATQLPAEKIAAAFKKEGLSFATSDDAGGYLCNECFYRLMRVEPKVPLRARGFVHVPDFGWPDPAGGTFTPAKLQRAVRVVVEQTIASVADKKGAEKP